MRGSGARRPRAPAPTTTARGRAGVAGRRGRPRRAGHARGGRRPGRGPGPHPRRRRARPGPGGCCTRGADAHYDQVSALIKSIRGSDADAGLYWLARMLEGGEDARFIARRLVILASEDVGPGRPAGPGGGRRRGPGRGVRRAARGPAQPGRGRRVPGPCARSRTASPSRSAGRRTTSATGPRADVPIHLRDAPLPRCAGRSDTARDTATPTTTPAAGWSRTTALRRWPATSTTSRAATGEPATRSERPDPTPVARAEAGPG